MADAFWDALAPSEELDRDDEAINRALRWRVIEPHLAGVETVLDLGAGTGAFSIPLAKRGYRVTHVDSSCAMLDRAAARAAEAGVTTLDFVEASALDLGRFADRSFDLVLNLDGAISFSGPAGAPVVIAESCRVTGGVLIATVSHKACTVPTWIHYSMAAAGRILPAVHAMIATGSWHVDQFPDNALLYPGVCRFPMLQAYTAEELTTALRACGLEVIAARGLGSLTHLLLPHAVAGIPAAELEELCAAYDADVMPAGPGSFRRAGLLAVARRPR